MEKCSNILKSLVVRVFLIAGLFVFGLPAAGQNEASIRGSVCDSLSLSSIPGVVIELLDRDSTIVHYMMSREDGTFLFNNLDTRTYLLRCTMLGYERKIIPVTADESGGSLPVITMKEDINMLDAAVAEEQAIRTSQSGDTLIYNAAAYKTILGSSSEDLLAKMPGIAVGNREVEANGRKVKRIMVDGKEFFADDVMTALRNVPADIVSDIEIVNQLSDEGEMTQMDDGENFAAINIVTKKRKQGKKGNMLTGRLYGGYGIPDKYIGGGSMNWFGDKTSATVLAMANNISRYNFVSDDLVSASSGDSNTAGKDFSVQPLAGLSSVQSAGGNFTNKWFTGSYLFNRIDNANHSENLSRRRVSDEMMQVNDGKNDYEAENMVHRLSTKFNFKKGKHSIIFRPSFSYQDIDDGRYSTNAQCRVPDQADAASIFMNNRVNRMLGRRASLRTEGRFNYSYRFAKPGRVLAFNVSGNYSQNVNGEVTSNAIIRKAEAGFDQDQASSRTRLLRDRNTMTYNAGGGMTYTEPLSKRSRLALDYRFNYADNQGDNTTWILERWLGVPAMGKPSSAPGRVDPRQSSVNRSIFMTHVARMRYGYYLKKLSLTANLAYQHVGFKGSAELPYVYHSNRHFNNFIYSLVAKIPFNQENTLRVDARSWTKNPWVQQMQDVVNLNNPAFVRAGNPDLRPSYFHKVNLRYLHTNRKKGSTVSLSFNGEGSASFIGDSLVVDMPDFVVTDDVLLGEGNQYLKYINLGGYYKFSTKLTYGFPIRALSSNFNVNANGSWSSVPGMINAEMVPVRRDRYSVMLKMDSNVSEFLDFTLGYDAGFSSNEYTNRYGKVRNNFFVENARGRLKWVFWKGFTLTGSVHWQHNLSTDKRYNDHRVFCDLFVGKRLFKNQLGEISIGCNDICNHTARWFRHNISASGTSDVSNSGVGRYFSIQFVYHLRKM